MSPNCKLWILQRNNKGLLSDFIKSLYAGILIGLAATVYLALTSMGAPIVGALLFGFGLFTILEMEYKLYTGQIGYLSKNLPIILIGNFIGAVAVGLILPLTKLSFLVPIATELCKKKLLDSLLSQFIMGFFCGILMFIAVYIYKNTDNYFAKCLMTFICISIFVLCGFEHCVANIFYFALSHSFSIGVVARLLIVVLGNSLGSLFISLPKRKFLDKDK